MSNIQYFIPCSRAELIKLCLADGHLSEKDQQLFVALCQLLTAHYNHQFHLMMEEIKEVYRHFAQEAPSHDSHIEDPEVLETYEAQLIGLAEELFQHANFTALDDETLAEAFAGSSLIDLKTDVDFNDFDRMIFYHQGKERTEIEVTRWWFWKEKRAADLFSRVVVLIKYREAEYFTTQGRKLEKLNFEPGHTYLFLYHNVPVNDLELLFPNVKLSMGRLDQVLFIGPAIAAGFSLVLKIIPNLLLVAGVILFFLWGPNFAQDLGVTQGDVTNMMPTLTALLTVLVALGGFAWRQYSGYQNKRLEFMKKVTETLFFRNIAMNASVFYTILDAAEEEETKEAILVYYHLLLNNGRLTPAQLDQEIEAWMDTHLKTKVDFDIEQTLAHLYEIKATIENNGESAEMSLIRLEPDGCCRALPLPQALQLLDRLWDDVYHH